MLELDSSEARQLADQIDESDGKFATVADLIGKRGVDGGAAFAAVMSLVAAGRRYRVSVSDLVASLKESFGIETAGTGISALLESATIQRFSKALSLRNEYERIVTDTRILSDIRPIFDDEQNDPTIEAAIVNHIIRVAYTAADGDHEVHLSLDAADLEKLQAQIERALKKDKAAQALLETAKVVVLEPIEELE